MPANCISDFLKKILNDFAFHLTGCPYCPPQKTHKTPVCSYASWSVIQLLKTSNIHSLSKCSLLPIIASLNKLHIDLDFLHFQL